MFKVGTEAEGKWAGIQTLFIETFQWGEQPVKGHGEQVDALRKLAEANGCMHVYFGVHNSYFFHNPLASVFGQNVVRAFCWDDSYLVTIEVDFLSAGRLVTPDLLERPQTRFLLTLSSETYKQSKVSPDASIRLLQHRNVELKLDGEMVAAVYTQKPEEIDLTYCRDKEVD